MKATLKEINGDNVLFFNDKAATCPFKTSVPVQDKFGQLQIINSECSDRCPHFTQNKETLTLTCGTGINIYIEPDIIAL